MKCSIIRELLYVCVCPIHFPSAASIRYADANWSVIMLRCKRIVQYCWDKIRFSIRLWTIFQFLRSMFNKIHSSILVSHFRFPSYCSVVISMAMHAVYATPSVIFLSDNSRTKEQINTASLSYILHSSFNWLLVAPNIPLVTLFPQIIAIILHYILTFWVV
jgi:hypothetical protein